MPRALQAAVDAEQFMFTLGPDDLWVSCAAKYWCGTPLEVYDGEECYDQVNPDGRPYRVVQKCFS